MRILTKRQYEEMNKKNEALLEQIGNLKAEISNLKRNDNDTVVKLRQENYRLERKLSGDKLYRVYHYSVLTRKYGRNVDFYNPVHETPPRESIIKAHSMETDEGWTVFKDKEGNIVTRIKTDIVMSIVVDQ